jgi:hypothetical protein
LVSTNATNGVNTYTLAGSSYPFGTGESIYYISGSDQFGNQFSDAIKITPVKILDGLSATLTNDNATLSALSNGFVASGSFVFTSGSVNVKVGNETITFDDDNDNARANNTFAITNLSGTGCTPNGGNNSNPSTNQYGITTLTADSGSLDITISYKDGAGDTTSIVKTATYTKNKKAAPVLRLEATPKDQSVSAKSTGEQVDSFSNVTISVKETYNGATSTLTITSLTATSSDISSISTTAASGLVSLNGKTLANGTNATTIAITAVITDSEGISRTLTDTLSLSKVKKATPNVEGQISPTAQTVTANSDGSSPATPTSLTVKALEGGTTRLTSVSAVGAGVTIGTITYNGTSPHNFATIPLSAVSADTATITVTINYTDSEGNTGSKTAIATISKAKKASPVVVISANPQSQTVAATAAGVYSAPATIAVSLNEGGTAYTYATSGNNTFQITSITGGTNASGVVTPTTPTTAAGVSGVITISYINSEGTTVTGKTINFSVGVAVQGSNGADGGAGPGVVYRGEWANGVEYYKSSTRVDVVSYLGAYYLATLTHTSATGNATTGQPGVGTRWTAFGAQFSSVATDVLLAQNANITRGLVMGTLGDYSGFIRSANATSLTAGNGFYLDVNGKVRFGDPSGGYIYFDGTDVNIAGAVKIGASALINGVAATTVQTGAASGATAQQNGSAKTAGSVGGWTIDGDAIYSGTKDASGYTTGGITLNSGGSIHSKNFYIDTDGNAFFKGDITGASGTFSGALSAATGTFAGALSGGTILIGSGNSVFKADGNGIYLGNATFGSAPFRVTPGGALTATGVNISGNLTATGGTFGGWIIDGNQLKSKDLPTQDRILLDGGANTITMNVGGLTRFNLNTDGVLPEPNVIGGGSISISGTSQTFQGNSSAQYNSNIFTPSNSVNTNFELTFSNSSVAVEYAGGSTSTLNAYFRIRNITTGNATPNVLLGTAVATGGDNTYQYGSVSGGGLYQGFSFLANANVIVELQVTAGHQYRAELYFEYSAAAEGTPTNNDSSYVKIEFSTAVVTIAVQVATVVINGGGFLSAVNAGKYLRMANNTPNAVTIEGGITWDKVGGRPGYVARAWVLATWASRAANSNFQSGTIKASGNVLAVGKNGVGWHNIAFTSALPKGNVGGYGDYDTLGAIFATGLRRYVNSTGAVAASTGEYQTDIGVNPNWGGGSSVMVYTYDNDRNAPENVNLLNVVVFA